MFKYIVNKYCLVLKRGENVQIILQLLFNAILLIKLKICKFFKGIDRPIVHYYAICWNEEKILPYVFDYYDDIVDEFIIYDNYSTDLTLDIVLRNKKATVIQFNTGGKFNDDVHVELKNNVWKKSRGKADYVIVCDIDEILYHPELKVFLNDSFKSKYSFFGLKGYEMFSEKFPIYDGKHNITDIVKTGFPSDKYSKPILFDPHRIVEINYLPGAHDAFPIGIARRNINNNLKLLHYKNLSLEYILNRIQIYRERLSDVNKEKGYGIEYERENAELVREFHVEFAKSSKII